MSNRAFLTWTEFTDSENKKTYGFRLSDDYQSYFWDMWDVPPPKDNKQFFQQVWKEIKKEDMSEVIDNCLENDNGMYVNQEYIDNEELKSWCEEEN